MSKRNSTVKIVDGKVVFSEEVLSYFENLRTEENSKWIDKYFDVLSDSLNINAEKFEVHHIIPAFIFRDENHKNRKETISLADSIEENRIKLSLKNHIKAHHCLVYIFPNNSFAKLAVYMSCGKIDIENFTNDEISEIAEIKEIYKNENQTKEEYLQKKKEYYENNKEEILQKASVYYDDNKEEILQKAKENYQKNRESKLKQSKENYQKNRESKLEYLKEYNRINKEEISTKRKKKYEENKDEISKYNNQPCIDPTNGTICSLCALQRRISRHKEKYQNVDAKNCIIKDLE